MWIWVNIAQVLTSSTYIGISADMSCDNMYGRPKKLTRNFRVSSYTTTDSVAVEYDAAVMCRL